MSKYRLSLLLVFFSANFVQASIEEEPCEELLAAFRLEAPALRDEKGEKIAIDEGDWKKFLDRKLKLSDGTVIRYRDLDSLSPGFWAMHRQDWERVTREISVEMRRELEQRGVEVWSRAHDMLDPLARYDLPLHGWGKHPLNKISEALSNEGRSILTHSPQRQMGIVPADQMMSPLGPVARTVLAESSLPLGFLPMREMHIPAYLRQVSQVVEPTDDAVVLSSFLMGEHGRKVLEEANVEVTNGSFRNDWRGRQLRRGNRAFRMPADEVSLLSATDTPQETLQVLMKEEFRLAEQISAMVQRLAREPKNSGAQKKLSRDLVEYLGQSGVPASSIKVGDSHVTLIRPMDEKEWKNFYEGNTAGFGVPGLDEMPELSKIANKLKSRGYDVLMDFSDDSLAGSLVDVENGRLYLSAASLFVKKPLESYWLREGALAKLPSREKALVSNATIDIETKPASPHRFENFISSARELATAIREHQGRKLFMDATTYQNQLLYFRRGFEYFRSNAEVEYSLLSKFQGASISPAAPIQIQSVEGAENLASVLVKTDEGPLASFRILTPKGADEAQVRVAMDRFLSDNDKALREARESLDEFRALSQLHRDEKANRLDAEQITAIAAQDRQLAANIQERVREANVAEFFQIYREDLMGEKGVSDIAKARMEQFKKDAQSSPQTLLALRAAHRDYFLLKEAPWNRPKDGLPNHVVDDLYEIMQAGAKSENPALRLEVYNFALDLAKNSPSNWVRMHMAGIFRDLGIKNEEVREILEKGLHTIKEDPSANGVANWSAMALAKLYPEIAIREFPYYIRDFAKPDPRGVILGSIQSNKIFHPDLVNAAIDAMGNMEVNSSPGYAGYLKAFNPENPALRKKIEDKLAQMLSESKPEEVANLYEIAMVVKAWKLHTPAVQKLYREYLTTVNPKFSISDVALHLLEMDPKEKVAIDWYTRELLHPHLNRKWVPAAGEEQSIPNTVSSPWNYLDLMEEFARFYPKDPVLLPSIERLENTFAVINAQYAGFSFKRFNALREKAGVPPMTPPDWGKD
jgi:hypothetical protein